MKLLKALLVVFLLIVVAYVAAGLLMSDAFEVETSATINAPSAKIHAWTADLKKWPEWTVWSQNEDDKPVITYGEKTAGVGAHQSWTAKSGAGELTITAADPTTGLKYTMFFVDGEEKMPAKCTMSYAKEGSATKVSWTMKGSGIPFILRPAFKLFMQGMIVSDFDESLAALKEKVEKKG